MGYHILNNILVPKFDSLNNFTVTNEAFSEIRLTQSIHQIICCVDIQGGPEKSIVSFQRVITSVILRILQKKLHHWKDQVTGFQASHSQIL